jgi:hypothetical protein
MPHLILKPSKKLLSGNMVPVDIPLGTFKPVAVTAVQFQAFARLIVCTTHQLQQMLINTSYQFSDPVPEGVLLEVANNYYYPYFDLKQPCPKEHQRGYFIYPQEWAPVTLQSKTGKLYGVIEARCGNDKHKADIEVILTYET